MSSSMTTSPACEPDQDRKQAVVKHMAMNLVRAQGDKHSLKVTKTRQPKLSRKPPQNRARVTLKRFPWQGTDSAHSARHWASSAPCFGPLSTLQRLRLDVARYGLMPTIELELLPCGFAQIRQRA
jgi:hypothetical protein